MTSTRRHVTILPLLLVAAFAGVGFGAAQSVFPVRFEASGAIATETQIIDAFRLEVEVDFGTATAVVPASEITQRCGDGDGCTLRIVADREGEVARHDGRFFVVEGTSWEVTKPQTGFGLTSFERGDIATPDGITIFFVGSFSNCRLIESSTMPRYELVADAGQPDLDPPVHCVLRIDD